MAEPEIAVIGITATSSPLADAEQVEVETPYGRPSAPISIGDIDGTAVAFLPRRGVEGEIPPPQIPSRANVWALKELGVRRIVAPIVCGALHLEYELGDIVVCDQFVDRTWGREDTYYTGPGTVLVASAQPFCDDLGTLLVHTARELGTPVHNGGTTVVVQGPRFSTTAESEFFRAMAWDTVNMHEWRDHELLRRALAVFGLESLAVREEAPREVVDLAERRQSARSQRDFEEADRLRAELEEAGWEARDEDGGYRLVPRR